MNQINKPASLIRDELVHKVVTAINESNLSYFVLEYIFKDLLNEIHNGAVKQAQAEQAAYMESVKAQAEAEAKKAETPAADATSNN